MDVEIIMLIMAGVVMLGMIYVARNAKQNKKYYILKELKKIKEIYQLYQMYDYSAKRAAIIFAFIIFIIVIFMNYIFLFGKFIYALTVLIPIDIVFLVLIYTLFNRDVKSIIIKDSILTIKYGKNIKEYDVNFISELRYKVVMGSKRALTYLYIKNRNEANYEEYFLSLYVDTQIIALMFLIECIKQNNLEIIDTISPEDIYKFMNENRFINEKDTEIKRIV